MCDDEILAKKLMVSAHEYYAKNEENDPEVLITFEIYEYIIKNNLYQMLGLIHNNPILFYLNKIRNFLNEKVLDTPYNALEYSILNGNINLAIELIKIGAQFEKNIISLCMSQPESLMFLLKYAQNISTQSLNIFDVNIKDENNNNILHNFFKHISLKNTNNENILVCIQIVHNFSPLIINEKNNKDITPIQLSTKTNDENIMQLFIDLKSDISIISKKGWHLMHYVARYGNQKMIDILLRYNMDNINILTQYDNMTPIIVASKYNNEIALLHLLERKCNIMIPDIYNNYANHYIAQNKNLKLLNLVMNNKCMIMENNWGYTPSDYIFKFIEKQFVDILDQQNKLEIEYIINTFTKDRIMEYSFERLEKINNMYTFIYSK